MHKPLLFALLVSLTLGCNQPTPEEDMAFALFKLKFDPNQERLNNLGLSSVIPTGHAAQTPEFRQMSLHYIELAPSALTLLGAGAIVYKGEETTKGGENAVDFDKVAKAGNNEIAAAIELKKIPPGTYEWIRASVTYQNYDIKFNLNDIDFVGDLKQQKGTVASFVGFNTYITDITPRAKALSVYDDKKQGFWAFETNFTSPYSAYNQVISGEAPAGATTVVNPLFATSPVPQGSCVVTGKFAQPLVITGNEKEDLTVLLSFSINNSLEWVDDNNNGQLDFYANGSTPNEKIVDMGLRGLIPAKE